MALHTRSHTTGEVAKHVGVFVPDGPAYGNHVACSAVFGIDGGQNMVE